MAECERNQTAWFGAQAEATGGAMWSDGGLDWVAPSPGGDLMLAFPRIIGAEALGHGMRRGHDLGHRSIGAWLGPEVATDALAAAGFEVGWAPWWMGASLDAVVEAAHVAPDVRAPGTTVSLEAATPEYDGVGRAMLAMTRRRPETAWHAVARVDGALAGRAWASWDGATVGIYDMEVWPAFRRRGLGRALLGVVCQAARDAIPNATHAVLNATPDGARLYERVGFVRLGDGITWWHHVGSST